MAVYFWQNNISMEVNKLSTLPESTALYVFASIRDDDDDDEVIIIRDAHAVSQ